MRGTYWRFERGQTLSNKIMLSWIYINPKTMTYSCRPCEFLGQTEKRLSLFLMDDWGWVPAPHEGKEWLTHE